MADYNVNMKQWNGTSFDNVLPLAYNAKQLGGQSLAEVKQWVQDNGLLLYTGQYTGTGTYGNNNPNSITFPFKPLLIFPPFTNDGSSTTRVGPVQSSYIGTSYKKLYSFNPNSHNIYAKLSSNGKMLQWYDTSSVSYQFNSSGTIYYFAAIGGYDMGGKIPVGAVWTITSNESWRVPATGRYMLELYGKGGNGFGTRSLGASGGSSCQHYDSITLTKGDIQQIVIGDYSNPETKFGSYSVNNGGNASYNTGGLGSGNYGKDGIAGSDVPNTLSNGALSQNYGYGGSWSTGSDGPGAVYLKYLGA